MAEQDNPRAVIGDNNPPDPIDEATAPFADIIDEAQNWADGTTVENEAQMQAVDALIKDVKRAAKEVGTARDAFTKPLHDAWKAEVARWKPTLDDLDRLTKCLLAAVDPFKRKLAEEKAALERAAWEATNKARREAEAAAARANASDIEAQREAESARIAAMKAESDAKAQARDGVKGLRTYDVTEVLDRPGYARWLWLNDQEWLLGQMQGRATACRHHVPGIVETRKEKRAA